MDNKHFRFIIATIGFVRDDAGRVLLIKHPRRGWELPGGAIQRGEDPSVALVREVREESGYTVRVTGFVGLYFDIDDETVVLQFHCELAEGETATDEGENEAAWFEPDHVSKVVAEEPGHRRVHDALTVGSVFCRSFESDPYRTWMDEEWALEKRRQSIGE